MTALSIRHMNFTLREREQEQARRDAQAYAALPDEVKAVRVHYWHVERRTRRGWKFHTHFYGTKQETAAFWRKHFLGNKEFRLHHMYTYKGGS